MATIQDAAGPARRRHGGHRPRRVDRAQRRPTTWRSSTSTRALVKSKGRVTVEVQSARREERDAFEQLPPDRRTILVIVSEVTRNGLTQAVLAIEEAHGRLDEALAGRRRAAGDEPPPRRPDRARRGHYTRRQGPPVATTKGVAVQVRVVADQPWDVKADVLAVPILGQPAFTGPLGELDKRAGGELKSLAKFGELKGKRFKSVLAGAVGRRSRPAGSSRSSPATPPMLDRETVVKLGASAERRLAGRKVRSLAIWLTPARRRARGRRGGRRRARRSRRRRGRLRPRRRSTARATTRARRRSTS